MLVLVFRDMIIYEDLLISHAWPQYQKCIRLILAFREPRTLLYALRSEGFSYIQPHKIALEVSSPIPTVVFLLLHICLVSQYLTSLLCLCLPSIALTVLFLNIHLSFPVFPFSWSSGILMMFSKKKMNYFSTELYNAWPAFALNFVICPFFPLFLLWFLIYILVFSTWLLSFLWTFLGWISPPCVLMFQVHNFVMPFI